MEKYFQKQPLMRKVLISLIPIILVSTYFFGLKVIALLLVSTASGIAVEYVTTKKRRAKVTEAVIVSSVLFSLTLSISTPLWVAVLGIAFGILFGKEVFGGFGLNIFNPAILARAFVFLTFPRFITSGWVSPLVEFPGGFVKWTSIIDGVTAATPMALLRTGQDVSFNSLLIGSTPGSIGETAAIAIVIGGIYLFVTKTAQWKGTVSTICGYLISAYIFSSMGLSQIDPLKGLFAGGILFGAVYMITDPVTSPKTDLGKYVCGLLIGLTTVVIREFAVFPEGFMFAVLVTNTFTPLIDSLMISISQRKKVKTGEQKELPI